MSFKKPSVELEDLIKEQKRDSEQRHVYPESIDPRTPVHFSGLTLRQKACLALSFFMTRKETAEVLQVSENTVKEHLKYSLKKLPRGEIIRYRQLRKKRYAVI